MGEFQSRSCDRNPKQIPPRNGRQGVGLVPFGHYGKRGAVNGCRGRGGGYKIDALNGSSVQLWDRDYGQKSRAARRGTVTSETAPAQCCVHKMSGFINPLRCSLADGSTCGDLHYCYIQITSPKQLKLRHHLRCHPKVSFHCGTRRRG